MQDCIFRKEHKGCETILSRSLKTESPLPKGVDFSFQEMLKASSLCKWIEMKNHIAILGDMNFLFSHGSSRENRR